MVNECRGTLHSIARALRQDFEKTLPLAQQHERFIHGDARQPSGEPRLFLKGIEMKEGLVKTLLGYIFSILAIIRYPLRRGENSVLVANNQFFESSRISAPGGNHQRTVRVFVYSGCKSRVHESDPSPPLRHKVKKPTSAPAKVHIEWTGISSTDNARAECDTSREWKEISWLHSSLRPVFWSGIAVRLALARCEFYSPGKRQPPLKQAIFMPETAIDEYSLEIAGRAGDTPIHERLGAVGQQETCQSVGTPSIGLDVSKEASPGRRKADIRQMTDLAGAGYFRMLRFDRGEQHALLLEQKHAQVKSSFAAQAACDLELLDCYPFGRCGPDHFTVAGASFARCSRVTLSLRSHIECMVRWNPARIARNGPLRSRLLLLLLASDLFVGCKARRNATPYHIHGVSRVCRIAERCSKKRHGIAKARAR